MNEILNTDYEEPQEPPIEDDSVRGLLDLLLLLLDKIKVIVEAIKVKLI